MDIPQVVWIVGGVAVLIVAVLVAVYVLIARRVNLTGDEPADQTPGWMRTSPLPESVAAVRADGEPVQVYDRDPGEREAAPFAEQIEDVVHSRLAEDPTLAAMNVDLGTAPDGGLEIWVEGERYTDVASIPDSRLRRLLQEAIGRWRKSGGG